jgi:hypothetical protein
MRERVGGRGWMSAHMRRGDFALIGWAMEKGLEDHLKRVKDRLSKGRSKLQELHSNNLPLEDDLLVSKELHNINTR